MSVSDDSQLRTVRIIGLPVALWAEVQEQFQDLLREFTLIASSPNESHPLPSRLLDLISEVTVSYSAFTSTQAEQLAEAARVGKATLDVDYSVPAHVATAAASLENILDEADEYCRAGEHLLTLASPPEHVAYRRWYLTQFKEQPAGQEAISWNDWRAQSSV